MGIDNPPIYRDFAFAISTADGGGLSILIFHVAPNTPYGLTIWSFDAQSPEARISDWTETASGVSVPIAASYTFNGSALPAADYDATFGAMITSSAAGQLRIQGVRHGGTCYGVFLNGLQLVANPTIRVTRARLANDGNHELPIQTQYPGQSVAFRQSPDLRPGSSHPAGRGTATRVHGPRVIVEFPVQARDFLYRVTSQ